MFLGFLKRLRHPQVPQLYSFHPGPLASPGAQNMVLDRFNSDPIRLASGTGIHVNTLRTMNVRPLLQPVQQLPPAVIPGANGRVSSAKATRYGKQVVINA